MKKFIHSITENMRPAALPDSRMYFRRCDGATRHATQ
jgi:hypothetical protein